MSGGQRPRRTRTESRERAIAAALREFASHGYDGTSTGTIAQRARIKQPYLYALFDDKRALFMACLKDLDERMLARFQVAVAGAAGPEDRLQAIVAAHAEMVRTDPCARLHLHAFAAASHEELRQPVRGEIEALLAAVAELAGTGRAGALRFLAGALLLDALSFVELPSSAGAEVDPG